MQEMQQGNDTTQENITAFFQGTSSQAASSSSAAHAKKASSSSAAHAKKPRAKDSESVATKKPTKKPAKKPSAAHAKKPAKKTPRVLQQGSAEGNIHSSAAHAETSREEKGQTQSAPTKTNEAKDSKRKLARNPSAVTEEIEASTMPPPEIAPAAPPASSIPRAARTIAEVFQTLNVNAQFLNDAHPHMGQRVARNVADLEFYTDFTGPDMVSLGHMGPNNFTR